RCLQYPGVSPGSRGMPLSETGASRLRKFEFSVWRKHADAIFRSGGGEPSPFDVRRDEASKRAHGSQLLLSLWTTDNRVAPVYGLRSLGSTGYGAVQVHEGDFRRTAHRRVQQ